MELKILLKKEQLLFKKEEILLLNARHPRPRADTMACDSFRSPTGCQASACARASIRIGNDEYMAP